MDPVSLLEHELHAFLILLAAILVFRLLTRKIQLAGLLNRKEDAARVSPERVQLLLATLAVSAKYLGSVVHGTTGTMPEVSREWLYLFGGSSGIYASVKAITTLTRKS